jgi:hypothetical protein
MRGPIDVPPQEPPLSADAPSPGRQAPGGRRPRLRWILGPAILGSVAGVLVVAVEWSRYVLVFVLVVSGLAWLLRIASDWVVERAGPRRGVALIGGVLFGSWLIMAISPPAPLRSAGFGPLIAPAEPKDPYALPPAGSRPPGLPQADQPIDLVQPLRDLVTVPPAYTPKPPPTPPADGRQGTPRVGLRLSAGQSRLGEGIVMIADVVGDGRPVRGQVAFIVDEREVARETLRVQGLGSQIEHRVAGLPVGVHAMRVEYLGTATFAAAASPTLEHRVVRR